MQANAMEDSFSVTAFGDMAGHVFDEVRACGRKVITENDRPAFVIQTSEEYERLIDLLADMRAEQVASERLAKPIGKTMSREEMMKTCGITQAELDEFPEVEIE